MNNEAEEVGGFITTAWYVHGMYIPDRTIYLDGGDMDEMNGQVDDMMFSRFYKSMCFLEDIGKERILVILNTPGGCVYNAMAIYDRIKDSPCKVIVRGYGSVMSAGALILQAGDERQISPNTTIMVHNGYDGVEAVPPKTFKAWADYGEKQEKRIYDIFFQRMKVMNKKLAMEDLSKMFQDDFIITGDQAVELGLADSIYTGKKKKK